MKYLIGIDGGGTKTDLAAADLNGNILYQTRGGPSNFLVEDTVEVSESILNLIEECRLHLKFNYQDVEVILIGTAGAGRKTDAEKLQNSILSYSESRGINFKKVLVESDARIALEGAFSGKSGAILIAGTGSIMFGKDNKGNIHRVGGFGRKIGDDGSGYNIGRKALNLISKQFDGRGSTTLITDFLKEKFNIDSPENLIIEIYGNNFDIASVAPLVFSAAEKEDAAALKIIDEETDGLLLHISAMKKKLNVSEFNCSLIGSLITKDNLYRKKFLEKSRKNFPEVIIKEPDYPPVVGAILMSKEFLNKNRNY